MNTYAGIEIFLHLPYLKLTLISLISCGTQRVHSIASKSPVSHSTDIYISMQLFVTRKFHRIKRNETFSAWRIISSQAAIALGFRCDWQVQSCEFLLCYYFFLVQIFPNPKLFFSCRVVLSRFFSFAQLNNNDCVEN